ncbi:hypothetical protein [Lentzea sp. NPDC004782]|uniref:hypothetical protein n=1 Tax=Lentzea sp. NPDC004782 TaxID=3154458 RepID=UPI0033A4F97D
MTTTPPRPAQRPAHTTATRPAPAVSPAQPHPPAAAALARIPESSHSVPPPAGSRPTLHRLTEPRGIPEQAPEAVA